MGSRSTQLASAEILLASAVDMTTDAATILIDAGEEESAQEVKTCAAFAEETLERLRQRRIAAEAAEASGAAEANSDEIKYSETSKRSYELLV